MKDEEVKFPGVSIEDVPLHVVDADWYDKEVNYPSDTVSPNSDGFTVVESLGKEAGPITLNIQADRAPDFTEVVISKLPFDTQDPKSRVALDISGSEFKELVVNGDSMLQVQVPHNSDLMSGRFSIAISLTYMTSNRADGAMTNYATFAAMTK